MLSDCDKISKGVSRNEVEKGLLCVYLREKEILL